MCLHYLLKTVCYLQDLFVLFEVSYISVTVFSCLASVHLQISNGPEMRHTYNTRSVDYYISVSSISKETNLERNKVLLILNL